MKTLISLVVLSLAFLFPLSAAAEEDCLKCHSALTKGRSVHPALSMGCTACHTAVNAKTVPHKISGKIAKGLSAKQPELCYGCHDKSMFEKKVVHPAVSMGCTTCHSPHASNTSPLLIKTVPVLCKTCHESNATGKHILAGYGLGDHHPTQGKPNPAHPNKELSCVSCHTPHSSDGAFLFTNEAQSAGNLCTVCHAKIMVRP